MRLREHYRTLRASSVNRSGASRDTAMGEKEVSCRHRHGVQMRSDFEELSADEVCAAELEFETPHVVRHLR